MSSTELNEWGFLPPAEQRPKPQRRPLRITDESGHEVAVAEDAAVIEESRPRPALLLWCLAVIATAGAALALLWQPEPRLNETPALELTRAATEAPSIAEQAIEVEALSAARRVLATPEPEARAATPAAAPARVTAPAAAVESIEGASDNPY